MNAQWQRFYLVGLLTEPATENAMRCAQAEKRCRFFTKSKEVRAIETITRRESFLAAAGGQEVTVPTPITRSEIYLAALSDENIAPPTAMTREEQFLTAAIDYIRNHSGGGSAFTLSYYDDSGVTLLYQEAVLSGGDGQGYSGDTPTKASTEQYDYSFVGWSSETGATEPTTDVLKNITADKSVYAAFEAVEKTFEVKFYNADVLLYTDENVEYGGTAAYSGNTPTKAETSEYTYTFAGWNTNSSASTADADALTNVTADRTVYAIFTAASKGYTVYFYNGETLLETVTGVPYGGTATYTGATPTSSQAGYIFSGWSPSNTNITADTSCYAQFEEDDMYESITDTWSQIIANVSNGTYSTKYHIGDTKKIDLGAEGEVIMAIAGIDTDDLADNSGKAPITWISKQLLKTSHRMNPEKQSGISGTGTLGGWEACEMRSYLINTIKPLIPEAVRNAIKPVKKYSRIYDVSGSAVNDVLTTEDVWIPSYKEVFGTGRETQGPTYSTVFPDKASRIKSKAGNRAAWWWLRSAHSNSTFNNNSFFNGVNTSGSYYYYSANDTGGVALCFCT